MGSLEALARPLAKAITDALGSLPDEAARRRVRSRMARSLRARGDAVAPPVITWQLAEALGVPGAPALAAAACFLYAAADLADDIADREEGVDRVQGPGDVHRMLFLQQALLAELGEAAPRLIRAFAQAGLTMCAGQELDLAAAGPEADPDAIAAGKAGAELAPLIAAPALAAGRDPGPWRDFGRAYGSLLQVFSDYADLFGKPDSPDWAEAKMIWPLVLALRHPEIGPKMRGLMAGDRRRKSRLIAARRLALDAGAADKLRELGQRQLSAMDRAISALGDPPLLPELREALARAVEDGLASLERPGRPQPAPRVRAGAAAEAAQRFLAEDPLFREAHEVNRWGLFGRPEVRGGLFGPLVICEALLGGELDLEPALRACFAAADPDGWRYYPGCQELPTDADCTGVALQLAARTGRREHPAARLGERALLANVGEDGRFPTWLEGGRHTRASIALAWQEGYCPGVNANALLGLWAMDPERHRELVRRGILALAGWLEAGEPAPAAYYSPAVGDCWGLKALLATRAAFGGEPAVQRAVAACSARLRRGLLRGRYGVLELALAAWTLHQLGDLAEPLVPLVALVDAQEADGGYPAEPFYKTVPNPVPRWYASRQLSTALALRTLRALRGIASDEGSTEAPTMPAGTQGEP